MRRLVVFSKKGKTLGESNSPSALTTYAFWLERQIVFKYFTVASAWCAGATT